MKAILEKLLKDAIEATIEIAIEFRGDRNLPSQKFLIGWMESQSDTSSLGKEQEWVEFSYSLLPSEIRIKIHQNDKVKKLDEYAKTFALSSGKFFPFFPPTSYANRAGEILLETYFDIVKSFVVREKIIIKLIAKFIEDIQSDNVILKIVLHIKDFKAPKAFRLSDSLYFRPINMEDIKKYGRRSSDRSFHIFSYSHQKWYDLKDWICEAEYKVSKSNSDAYNNLHGQYIAEELSSSINITKCGRATFFPLERYIQSPFVRVGVGFGGIEVHTSRTGAAVNLNSNDIVGLRKVHKKLSEVRNKKDFQYFRLPLERLRSSSYRRNGEDQLVDCVIGLERLLAPGGGESSFKFRIRGASLLPDSYGSNKKKIELMGKLYKLRSDIVHGNSYTKQDVENFSIKAEEVLREILKWYLFKGINIGNPLEVVEKLDQEFVISGNRVRSGAP